MRRRFLAVSAAFSLLMVAACGPDAVAPKNGEQEVADMQVVAPTGATCDPAYDAARVTADLSILMGKLTPNDQSAQSKFAYVMQLMSYDNPDSTAKANAVAQDPLIKFVSKKYSQISTAQKNASITDSQGHVMKVSDLYNQVITEINCFTTPSNYDIPKTNEPVTIVLPTADAGAYFPEDFCGTNCDGVNVTQTKITPCEATPQPGCALGTLLDKYGEYIRIELSGDVPDPNTAPPVVVALCVPGGVSLEVANRLQVGHQNTGTVANAGFSVLDLPLGGLPADLAAALSNCLPLGASNDAPGSAPRTMLARMVDRVADLLLPQKASAHMFMATLGVGGTTRKFSPFGLVDPRLSASGGLGGTKTSFAPAMSPATRGAPSLATMPDGSLEDSAQHRQTALLPKVQVKTNLGTPIPGVLVTFTVQPTILAAYQPGSNAVVCDGSLTNQGSITVFTNAAGEAELPCLNFGTTVGYKQVAATIDPSTAPGLSEDGGLPNVTVSTCDPTCGPAGATTTLYWLVKTNPGNAAKLAIKTQPSTSAQSGDKFAQQPVLEVQDASGNLVTGSVLDVTATITTSPGGTPTLAAATKAAVGGVATFTDLAISGQTGNYKLTFNASNVTGAESGDVTLAAGSAAKLAFVTQPGTNTNGARADLLLDPQPVLQVQDAAGNPVDAQNIPVTVELVGSSSLSGTTGVTTSAIGVATFTNLKISGTAGNSYALKFTGTGLPSPEVTSASFILTAGVPAALVITQEPSPTALAGEAFGQQPWVELRDASNNLVTAVGDQVSVAAAITSEGLGTLAGTAAQTTVGGVAKFTDLEIDGLTGSRTLDFTSGALTPDTSDPITIDPGAAKKLVVKAISTSVAAGQPFTTKPLVEVQDQFGNKTASTASIGVAVEADATLGGTTPVAAVDGSATFTDLTIGGLGSPGARTLTFSATGLDPATAPVTVTVGPDKKLVVKAIATSVAAGEAFGTLPVVEVQDQFGNKTASSAAISAAVSAGASLGGTTTNPQAAVAGSATFTDLTIGGLGSPGARTLTFTSTGLDQATAPVTVTIGPDKKLVITASSTSVQAGVLFAIPPVVEVQDQFGNKTASTASILAGISAPGTIGGANPKSAVAGVATFSNLTIGPVGSPGSRTLTFTSGSLTPDSRVITVGDPLPDWLSGGYRYLLPTPKQGGGPTDFQSATFDDAAWTLAAAPFGPPSPLTYSNCTLYNSTSTRPVTRTWTVGTSATGGGSDILVRKTFTLLAAAKVKVLIAIDNDVQVFLDGVDKTTSLGVSLLNGLAKHEGCPTRPTGSAYTFTTTTLTAGSHVLAIRARDRGGVSYLDAKVTIVP